MLFYFHQYRASIYIRSPRENGDLQLIGKWNGSEINCRTINMYPKDRLSNLFGKTLRASSFEYKPYTYVIDTIDGNPVYDGVEVSMRPNDVMYEHL